MKRYNLYGEVNFSPIRMKSNSLSDIQCAIQQLKKTCAGTLWYSLFKVYKYTSEELLQSEIISTTETK